MGFVDFESEPLTWADTKKNADRFRERALEQFVNFYDTVKDRDGDAFLWGDEVEYMLMRLNHEKKQVRLVNRGDTLCKKLQDDPASRGLWREEYARFMLESSPSKPYKSALIHINELEPDMIQRRQEVEKYLKEDEHLVTMAVFPRLGCPSFTLPEIDGSGPDANPWSHSSFFPDQAITSHPRYIIASRNARERKGSKVEIKIPVYKDVNTSPNFQSPVSDRNNNYDKTYEDNIYMDCVGFAGGNCGVQVTVQACDMWEARNLHDQLAAVAPLMLALSAASPIFKGCLSDTDVRSKAMEQGLDDRTDEEKGLEPLACSRRIIRRSKWSSIASYLSPASKKYNDVGVDLDEAVKSRLQKIGMDEEFAQFIAHIWIRDPLAMFSDHVDSFDPNKTDLFETMYSSIWPTVRLKMPCEKPPCGWRVEFRVYEAQLTDFENAAYLVFVVLLSKLIQEHKLDMLMPISMVDANMEEAQKRDSARRSSFWFKTKVSSFDRGNGMNGHREEKNGKELYKRMTLDTVMNGEAGGFPGLIALIRKYVEQTTSDVATTKNISAYLALLSGRASGKYLTAAQWIREFVLSHPEYGKDSIVTESLTYDLVLKCTELAAGEVECPRLFRRKNN